MSCTGEELHDHCIRLRGLDPNATQTFELRQYAQLSPTGFPVGKPINILTFEVPIRNCHTSEYFSLTMAQRYIQKRYCVEGWISLKD